MLAWGQQMVAAASKMNESSEDDWPDNTMTIKTIIWIINTNNILKQW